MAEAVAIAAAAAATSIPRDSNLTEFNATSALVDYLRMEADFAEEKARKLRQQAASLAQRFGVSEAAQLAYEIDPGEMPPLDENGVPRYKGKKRGRKPKPRKRKANPNRRKRQHTGYTLYMQECYPVIKEENAELASKDIIAMLAKQWAEMVPDEKSNWKARALATHAEGTSLENEEGVAAAAAAAAVEDPVEEGVREEEDGEDDDDPAPPARKSKRVKR